MPLFVQLGPHVFQHRRGITGPLPRFGLILVPLQRQPDGQRINLATHRIRAQGCIGQTVLTRAFRQNSTQRPAPARQASPAARDHFTFVRQQIFRHIPAAVFLANDLVLGHLHIREKRLAKRRNARDHPDRPRLDTRIVHINQQKRNALVLGRICVRTDQCKNPVGLVRIGGPDFLPVDQPVIALIGAFGLHRGQIGPRARLRITLTPADLATGDRWQIMQLLLMRPKVQQCWAQHPDAKALQRRPRVDPRHFLVKHLFLFAVQPRAAVFHWPCWHGVTLGSRPLQPVFLRRRGKRPLRPAPANRILGHASVPHLLGTVLFEPAAQLRAKGFNGLIAAHFDFLPWHSASHAASVPHSRIAFRNLIDKTERYVPY